MDVFDLGGLPHLINCDVLAMLMEHDTRLYLLLRPTSRACVLGDAYKWPKRVTV